MSMADAQLVLELKRRIDVLEAVLKGDPLIERVQRLEMRCGSLQSQFNLLRQNKTPPLAPRSATPAELMELQEAHQREEIARREDKANAAAR